MLVERGLVTSRQRGQALILAGKVRVDGCLVDKAGHAVGPHQVIDIVGKDIPYVSRGGLKLREAIQHFQEALRIQPNNMNARKNLTRALAARDRSQPGS